MLAKATKSVRATANVASPVSPPSTAAARLGFCAAGGTGTVCCAGIRESIAGLGPRTFGDGD